MYELHKNSKIWNIFVIDTIKQIIEQYNEIPLEKDTLNGIKKRV